MEKPSIEFRKLRNEIENQPGSDANPMIAELITLACKFENGFMALEGAVNNLKAIKSEIADIKSRLDKANL